MAQRLTVSVSDGMIVFTSDKSAVGCGHPQCLAPATRECGQPLAGRFAGQECRQRFCGQHGMVVGGVLRCGPHARVAMKAKGM
jgi:hypothetical protein